MPADPLLTDHPALGAGRPGAVRPQRARLLAAAATVVGERGYASTTVADVVRAAGVSRSTFYAEFAGKEELFVEAYRHGVEVLNARVDEAVRAADGWRQQLRAGIEAYLRTMAADARFARAYLLEVQLAGPAALAVRDEALHAFAARYRRTFVLAARERETLHEPPADALRVLCAGTEQLAAEHVRAGRADRLAELADVFCLCAEALLTAPAPADPDLPAPTPEH
ncbi:TetR/AcrR family transcriptional regulator [Patulibacter sp. SYSU D01012]|uniref:TetR/AcrR family transcriptional regulator n=1 Tax=Patulibacter sp. SYSU D01012 TaxID=2817381 RepID=UPI001B304B95